MERVGATASIKPRAPPSLRQHHLPPVVLHHGLAGFGHLKLGRLKLCYFGGIERGIASRGFPMIVSGVHPTAGIVTRARQLKANILRQLNTLNRRGDRVVILAHSMGGLDARYMITKLGMADRVAALATVTAPHRGSPYADWCVRNIGRVGGFALMNLLGLDLGAISDLTTENCRRFNDEVPDAPGVRYFSVSAARPWHRVPPFALHAHRVIYAAEGDNDSLVSVRSSRWGKHLGTWPADHWHTINHRYVLELRHPTGDIVPYWLRLVDRVMGELGVVRMKAEG